MSRAQSRQSPAREVGRDATVADRRLALAKYRLLARLGSGGMADVFLALSGHGAGGYNKLLVLKVLRPDLPEPERADFFQMFQDEGRLAMRLSHPNIVQAYEVGTDGTVSFIAMEYLEGQPLSMLQERGWHAAVGITLEMQIHILCEVLDGLQYAHTIHDYSGRPLHIVHRDVSPQNVFVTYTGHTKLVDFGIAKTLESNSKTAAGVVKGKVPYLSPEQVRCGNVDHRADLFSVGVMLWEAAARQCMHGGASLYEVLRRLVGGDLPRLRDVVPDVDPELDRIVTRALALEPEHRYPDAAAFREDLLGLLQRHGKVSSRELGERVGQLFDRELCAVRELIRRGTTESAPDDSAELEEQAADLLARLPWLSAHGRGPSETGRATLAARPPHEPNPPAAVEPAEAQRALTASAAALVLPAPGSAASRWPEAAAQQRRRSGRWLVGALASLAVAALILLFVAPFAESSSARDMASPADTAKPRGPIERPRALPRAPAAAVNPADAMAVAHARLALPRDAGPPMDMAPAVDVALATDVALAGDIQARENAGLEGRPPRFTPTPLVVVRPPRSESTRNGRESTRTSNAPGQRGQVTDPQTSSAPSTPRDDEMYPDLPIRPAANVDVRAKTSSPDDDLYPDLPRAHEPPEGLPW